MPRPIGRADLLIYPSPAGDGWLFGLALEYDDGRVTSYISADGEILDGCPLDARVSYRHRMTVEPFNLLITLPVRPVTFHEARELIRPYRIEEQEHA